MITSRVAFGGEYNGPRVLITVPTTGNVRKELAEWLLEVMAYENHMLRCHGDVCFPTDRPYEQNQHNIVNDLKKHGYEYWVSIDDDNPPTKNILDLIFLQKDMIGCPTPVWKYVPGKAERPFMWNAYDYVSGEDAYKEHDPKEGLQEVDAVGTGCFIIAQYCFNHVSLRQGAFTRKIDDQGLVYKGNDISFCERFKAAGFHIFAHYDYPCRHITAIDLFDNAKAIGEMMNHG